MRLGRRFGAVVLASHLVNSGDDTRDAFLETCRLHVAPRGRVIIQQHPPGWFAAAAASETTAAGITYRLRDLSRPAPGLLSATVEYVVGNRTWTHTFTATALPEERLDGALAKAHLARDAYLTGDHGWLRAVPLAASR